MRFSVGRIPSLSISEKTLEESKYFDQREQEPERFEGQFFEGRKDAPRSIKVFDNTGNFRVWHRTLLFIERTNVRQKECCAAYYPLSRA